MSEVGTIRPQVQTHPAAEVIRATQVAQAGNGICYAALGETAVSASELERMVLAIPRPIAAALDKKAYYFLPLTVREGGETSLDAHEFRKLATGGGLGAEKAKNDYFAAAFSDAVAVYMLSLCLDVDYYELREREYPLLAPQALAERVRKIHELFPPNPGVECNIFYRQRTQPQEVTRYLP